MEMKSTPLKALGEGGPPVIIEVPDNVTCEEGGIMRLKSRISLTRWFFQAKPV